MGSLMIQKPQNRLINLLLYYLLILKITLSNSNCPLYHMMLHIVIARLKMGRGSKNYPKNCSILSSWLKLNEQNEKRINTFNYKTIIG